MKTFQDTQDPNETKDFAYDWALQLGSGETISNQTVAFIDAAGTSTLPDTYAGSISRVWLSGGTHGQRAIFTVRIETSGGRTLEEAFAVDIVDSTIGQSPADKLRVKLSEAEDALHALIRGERVVEVVRDGRRVRYESSGRGDLAEYIRGLSAEIAALEAPVDRPRRRFIGVGFR